MTRLASAEKNKAASPAGYVGRDCKACSQLKKKKSKGHTTPSTVNNARLSEHLIHFRQKATPPRGYNHGTSFSGSTRSRARGALLPTRRACASKGCPHSHILKPSCFDLLAQAFVQAQPGFSHWPCLRRVEDGVEYAVDDRKRGTGIQERVFRRIALNASSSISNRIFEEEPHHGKGEDIKIPEYVGLRCVNMAAASMQRGIMD